MRLRIQYRSGDDEVTERLISEFVPEPPNTIHALCELRGEVRSFRIDRIETAVDIDTGEIIHDLWELFGLRTLKRLPQSMPSFPPVELSAEQARGQRRADKAALFARFKYPVIASIHRRKLWHLFDGRCFRCAAESNLELDHRAPQYFGGRLVPGNVVLLCDGCNYLKRARYPADFYCAEQLQRLEPILRAELTLFDFTLNRTRWANNRREYLVSLGATEGELYAALIDRNSVLYVGLPVR